MTYNEINKANEALAGEPVITCPGCTLTYIRVSELIEGTKFIQCSRCGLKIDRESKPAETEGK